MEFWRKVLIFIIMVILLFVLYRLTERRIQLLNHPESVREGLSDYTDSDVNYISTANKTIVGGMNSFSPSALTTTNGIKDYRTAIQLQQYCIKSSFNSAYNGKKVSFDMVRYVLDRGCRFLDFEIYWSKPSCDDSNPDCNADSQTVQACVSWSTDAYIPSTNLIPLSGVFDNIIENAYSKNITDPIFIQLRPKVSPSIENPDGTKSADNRAALYNSMANALLKLDSVRYVGNITNTISMNDLCGKSNTRGKLVVVMDTINNPEYARLSSSLKSVVNIDNKSKFFNTYTMDSIKTIKATPVKANPDYYSANINSITQTLPMNSANQVVDVNLDYSRYITEYGCQITPQLFHSNDEILVNYETMFNNAGSAFIPITKALSITQNTQATGKMFYPDAMGGSRGF